MGATGIERPHDSRIVATRWQIVSERLTSDNSGCEQRSHRPISLETVANSIVIIDHKMNRLSMMESY